MARNTISLSVADVVGKAASFVYFLVAARHLTPGPFGALSAAMALVTMAGVLTDLGLGQLAVREIARDRSVAFRLLANSVALKVVALAFAAAVAWLAASLLRYQPATLRLVFIIGVSLLDVAFTTFYRLVFQAFQVAHYAALARGVQAAVLAMGLVLIARLGAGVEAFAWLYVSSSLAVVGVSWLIVSFKLVRPGVRFRPVELRSLVRASAPFAVAALLVTVYYWIGVTMLSRFSGERAVGLYSAAFRLVFGLTFLSSAFAGALYPVMSRLYVSDGNGLSRMLTMALRVVLLLAFPVAVIGSLFSGSILRLIYGPEFCLATPILRVLCCWAAVSFLNCVLGHFFLSVDRPHIVTAQAGLALLFAVTANLALIPNYGALGVAVSLLGAETLSLVFLLTRPPLRSAMPAPSATLSVIARPLFASLLAAGVGILAGVVNRTAGVLVAVGMYAPLLLFLKGTTAKEIGSLFGALSEEPSSL